jgi:hypothetical protein
LRCVLLSQLQIAHIFDCAQRWTHHDGACNTQQGEASNLPHLGPPSITACYFVAVQHSTRPAHGTPNATPMGISHRSMQHAIYQALGARIDYPLLAARGWLVSL